MGDGSGWGRGRYKRRSVGLATKVTVLCGARFLAMPVAGAALLAAGTRLGVIPADDPLLRFVLLMEASMPPSQNSVVLLQLDNDRKGAGSMAKTISALYLAAVVPVAALLSLASMHAGLA